MLRGRTRLEELGDDHSFFLSTSELDAAAVGAAASNVVPIPEVCDGVGLVEVREFDFPADAARDAYVRELRAGIEVIDRDVIGWIVDLRRNEGGSMWPMIGGLHPLLGDGILGFFVLVDERWLPWGLHDGGGFTDESAGRVRPSIHPLIRKPVAVLIGEQTVSAGEAVAVAFRGQPNARLFGSRTGGLNVNRAIELPDGAMLFLTTGLFTDRNRVTYSRGVDPDENVAVPDVAAHEWVRAKSRGSGDA